MDRSCPRQKLKDTLRLICTNIGEAASLPEVDISMLIGKDVADACTQEKVNFYNKKFGLCPETARKNSITDEQMYLYTNPCLLDRAELFAYLVDLVEQRGTCINGAVQPSNVEEDENENLLIKEQKDKYRIHKQHIMAKENAKHMLRLQKNKELLRRLLLPQTLSTRFLLEMHHYITSLLCLVVVEESLQRMRERIVTVPTIFDHATQDLFRLSYLNEQSVHVESFANGIQGEALNAFFPPHYSCWDNQNPLSHSMQPLLDCYARTDASTSIDDSWHDQIKAAYTMAEYLKLQSVEDILISMVAKGDNIVPIPSDDAHSMKNDAELLRFIICVLFVIHVCNLSQHFEKPLSFSRLDNPANLLLHGLSNTYVYNLHPGRLFCHGGYLYIRPPTRQRSTVVLRSKCILSLCLELSAD